MHEEGCVCSVLHVYFLLYTYGICHMYAYAICMYAYTCAIWTYAYGKDYVYGTTMHKIGMSYLYRVRMNTKYTCK